MLKQLNNRLIKWVNITIILTVILLIILSPPVGMRNRYCDNQENFIKGNIESNLKYDLALDNVYYFSSLDKTEDKIGFFVSGLAGIVDITSIEKENDFKVSFLKNGIFAVDGLKLSILNHDTNEIVIKEVDNASLTLSPGKYTFFYLQAFL